MVLADELHALLFEQGDALRMQDNGLQLLVHAFVVGLHVDDGTKLLFVEDVVAFRLSSAHNDDAFRHGQQGIHGWCIAIKLVENQVATVHHPLVLGKRQSFGYLQLYFLGIFLLKVPGSL